MYQPCRQKPATASFSENQNICVALCQLCDCPIYIFDPFSGSEKLADVRRSRHAEKTGNNILALNIFNLLKDVLFHQPLRQQAEEGAIQFLITHSQLIKNVTTQLDYAHIRNCFDVGGARLTGQKGDLSKDISLRHG